jgi:hypothetical protein
VEYGIAVALDLVSDLAGGWTAVLRQERRGAPVGHYRGLSQKLIARMIAMAGELGVPTWRARWSPVWCIRRAPRGW